jgi:hypothetical protein
MSAYRGGNKLKIDLEVIENSKNSKFSCFGGDKIQIQIKRTATPREALRYLNEGIYFITLDLKLDTEYKDHPYFIGKTKLDKLFLLDKDKTQSTQDWIIKVLRTKFFDFEMNKENLVTV